MLQSWVYGDSFRDHLIVFVVVDPERLEKYSKDTGKEVTEELMQDPDLINAVYKDLMRLAAENKLNSLEKPK